MIFAKNRWRVFVTQIQRNMRFTAIPTSLPHRYHDYVMKWKHFLRYWPFVRGIHRSPVNSPHKGQWRGALMFSLICVRISDWVNNREAGDLRRRRAHYDVTVMTTFAHATPVQAAPCVTPGTPLPAVGRHRVHSGNLDAIGYGRHWII